MANTYTKLGSYTVSGNVGISFSNIPATYTDLHLRISGRDVTLTGNGASRVGIGFNALDGSGTPYTYVDLKGNGSTVSNTNTSGANYFESMYIPNPTYTSNLFAITSVYIPNYASTTGYKSMLVEDVTENNATYADSLVRAATIKTTAAIANINIYDAGGVYSWAAGTTASLYGIKNS